MWSQVRDAVIHVTMGGFAPQRGVKPRFARLLHYVPPLRVTPRTPAKELVNGSLSRTRDSTGMLEAAIHGRSAHFVRAVVLEGVQPRHPRNIACQAAIGWAAGKAWSSA